MNYTQQSAFPIIGETHLIHEQGMTLREHYAGLALQALISKSPFGLASLDDIAYKEAAKGAMAYANALMEIKDL